MTSPQRKIDVTSKSPVGDISVVTLIRTDTTLDHSQKAEKVCLPQGARTSVEIMSICALLLLSLVLPRVPKQGSKQQLFVHWHFNLWSALAVLLQAVALTLLGRSPHKNCKNDLDDQT